LQCVAVCCSVLQCVVVWRNVVQCIAVCRVYASLMRGPKSHICRVCCSVLQCVAVCCSELQFVAVYMCRVRMYTPHHAVEEIRLSDTLHKPALP